MCRDARRLGRGESPRDELVILHFNRHGNNTYLGTGGYRSQSRLVFLLSLCDDSSNYSPNAFGGDQMKIKTITIRAGMTTNNPHRSYSNLQSGITLEVEVVEGEDWKGVVEKLQIEAEACLAKHRDLQLRNEEIKERLRFDDQIPTRMEPF